MMRNIFFIFILAQLQLGTALAVLPKVLILSKSQPDFLSVAEKIKSKLKEISVTSIVLIERNESYSNFENIIKKESPTFTILMDNMSLNYAQKYNLENKKNKIKCISIMALNISNNIRKGDNHIAGIEYEAPIYSLISEYRYITKIKLKTLLTFYRKSQFNHAIKDAKNQLALEGITLKAINVEQLGTDQESINSFLSSNVYKILSKKDEYEALWLPLDSILLSNKFFNKFWYKNVNDLGISVITQEPKLSNPKLNFSTFSVGSNLNDLTGQTAQLIYSLINKEVSIREIGVEKVFSIKKVLNEKKAKNLDILHREYKMRVSREELLN